MFTILALTAFAGWAAYSLFEPLFDSDDDDPDADPTPSDGPTPDDQTGIEVEIESRFGEDHETFTGTEGNDVFRTEDVITDFNITIQAGGGEDHITVGDGNIRVNAGEGDDTIVGDGQELTLRGGPGDDTIELLNVAGEQSRAFGGSGNDVLTGEGDIILNGGEGDDTLSLVGPDVWYLYGPTATGGAGADTFEVAMQVETEEYNGPLVSAVITDFDPDEDQLEVSMIDTEYYRYESHELVEEDGNTIVTVNFEALSQEDLGEYPQWFREDTPCVVVLEGVTGLSVDDISFVRSAAV